MKFHEKLNLLMNLQSIPNNKLAKALSVDPSLISRWRNGTRDLAKHSEYVTGIATFFACHTADKERLLEILDADHIDQASLVDKIWHWLSDDLAPSTQRVDDFIARFNLAKESILPPFIPELLKNTASGKKLHIEVYHGNFGKRESILRFLKTVIAHETPCTLKLYNDDSSEWMLEDPDFCNWWAHLIAEIIRRGNRIIIVHTIDPHSEEMQATIDRWLPFYMTGSVDPYYYPGHQESTFNHTLFLAPEVVAIKSSAMAQTTLSEYLLYQEPSMLAAFDEEFDAYLEHCRPLIKVFTIDAIEKFQTLFHEFESQKGNLSILSKTPSLSSMSPFTFSELISPMNSTTKVDRSLKAAITNHYNHRIDAFNKNIEIYKQCEWLHLPEIELLKDNAFSYVGPLDWFAFPKPTFEPAHYVQHVANVLQLMQRHKTYNVHLTHLSIPDDLFIALKQDVGVIVCKIDQSPVFMALNHMSLINAFENFIEEFTDTNCSDSNSKAMTIRKIEMWLEQARAVLNIT